MLLLLILLRAGYVWHYLDYCKTVSSVILSVVKSIVNGIYRCWMLDATVLDVLNVAGFRGVLAVDKGVGKGMG